jgi:hypothetical protein
MYISQKILLSFVPGEQMRMNFWYAHGIVKKQYCGRMTASGLCPEICNECKAHLQKSLSASGSQGSFGPAFVGAAQRTRRR